MHRGVDMAPTELKPVRRISGIQFFARSRHRMMPVNTASMEGLTRAAFREMCFFSPVRVKTPTVQARMLRAALNMEE